MDAMNKLINDLRKFGYSAAKTLKVESVKQGYGEQVCHIIDELLNLELYRREFQFLPPKFAPDVEDEEADEASGGEDNEEDNIIRINGGMIEAREVKGDSPDVITKKARNRIREQASNVEETKINFFDPSQYRRNVD